MRTLIISDLHLGQRPGADVLRRPAPLARLLATLDGIDRLILLGDVVELASRIHGRRPMQIAGPVLSQIGARMGPEREIVLVAGNHDSVMVRDWVRRRGDALGLADEVPGDATPTLAAVVAALAPARVTVRYPGVWVRDDVWATHGHYLDRHLVPETTFGLRRVSRRRPSPGARPAEYEVARRHRARRRRESHGFWHNLRERPVAAVLEQIAELSRHAGVVLRHAHLTSLTAGLLDMQARHAATPALGHAAGRLGVGADFVVFGHHHRAGPDAGDVWEAWPGGPRLLNTGSWVFEPLVVDGAGPSAPYWPGGAVLVEPGRDPQVLHLLAELDAESLRGDGRGAARRGGRGDGQDAGRRAGGRATGGGSDGR